MANLRHRISSDDGITVRRLVPSLFQQYRPEADIRLTYSITSVGSMTVLSGKPFLTEINARRDKPIRSQSVRQSQQEALMRTVVSAVLAAVTASFSVANAHEGTVYVAGKARYCKETPVSGYLDCFYSSLDACEKHNKAANLRCVANPNSGT